MDNRYKKAGLTPAFLSLLLRSDATEALIEFVDATAAIYNFLLTSVERVTLRAHIDMDVFAQS